MPKIFFEFLFSTPFRPPRWRRPPRPFPSFFNQRFHWEIIGFFLFQSDCCIVRNFPYHALLENWRKLQKFNAISKLENEKYFVASESQQPFSSSFRILGYYLIITSLSLQLYDWISSEIAMQLRKCCFWNCSFANCEPWKRNGRKAIVLKMRFHLEVVNFFGFRQHQWKRDNFPYHALFKKYCEIDVINEKMKPEKGNKCEASWAGGGPTFQAIYTQKRRFRC